MEVVGGTVYPLLQRLENQEMIVGEMVSSPDGPDRKYFSITDIGLDYLEDFSREWANIQEIMDRMLGE